MDESAEYSRHKTKHTHRVLYRAGYWRDWFSKERFQLIVALALNDWVVHEEKDWGKLYITGYLITECRLYLEVKTTRKDWKHLEHYFFERVKHYIAEELKEKEYCYGNVSSGNNLGPVLPLQDFKLFTVCPLYENWLLQLITGHSVETGYDHHALNRLKAWLDAQRFCSVIDYKGGDGPVMVVINEKIKV
ncbi:MAG: hypothetical protein NTW29_16880 [Bacteroidetes bacterium]|nr:hypothetical protein [Bacteroidota bacterium]